jgi:serine/threonine-protein kinase
MDVEEGLEFADKLIYSKTGKHLNDLEREVFLGSWQGHTYEKMYPINPEMYKKMLATSYGKNSLMSWEKKSTRKTSGGH